MPEIVFDNLHLACDGGDLDALHRFASLVGLRSAWFQNHPTHPHYDVLSKNVARRVVEEGALVITPRQMARLDSAGRLRKGAPCRCPLTAMEEEDLRCGDHLCHICQTRHPAELGACPELMNYLTRLRIGRKPVSL